MTNLPISPALLCRVANLPAPERRSALRTIGDQEWQRCAADILYWLEASRHGGVPYVFTIERHPQFQCQTCPLDSPTLTRKQCAAHLRLRHGIEDDVTDAILRKNFVELPAKRPFTVKPYMPPLLEMLHTEQYFAIEKSRDMVATWMVVAFYTWDTIFHEGRQNVFQSVNGPKTRELVERAWIMFSHQPGFLKRHKAEYGFGANKAGHFRVPALASEIIGFPQGPDQIRQLHPSGVFTDETAYQGEGGAAFAAIKPAIEKGGRYTALSSAHPSWFERVCKDIVEE